MVANETIGEKRNIQSTFEMTNEDMEVAISSTAVPIEKIEK